ncbi:MAG: hypothetical protein A2901_07755 [Elusimicrobia bacterium RIFCSPLOWO2_01_FULL_54_10]|nr:MAG: hypothetical protein A2901_07755 [Elusimicrobia bacterium RIFCSPLOWO2_01_FULL_54_10]
MREATTTTDPRTWVRSMEVNENARAEGFAWDEVGAWIWVQVRAPSRAMAAALAFHGFRFSRNRNAYYHDCGYVAKQKLEGDVLPTDVYVPLRGTLELRRY